MKVLWISNYKDGSGWAIAGQEYILALDAVGVDVVPRHIKLNDQQGEIPKRILELEQKDDRGCDVVIQNVLPHFMDYCGAIEQNIGLYLTETSNFKRAGWAQYINLMDEGWVTCEDSVRHSIDSDVSIPISVIPVPCDPSKYAQHWDKLEFPELKDKFVFYFIGEAVRRKNLVALLKAFHLEFEPEEPVGLLIKTSYPGLSPSQCSKKIVEMTETVKKQLKKYRDIKHYKGEVILTQRLTRKQIMSLHAGCDCFVMPSFGEGWCLPAFDAMGMGKTPICTNTGGMKDFLSVPIHHSNSLGEKSTTWDTAGWLIKGTPEPCFGMAESAVPNLYTGMELWNNIDINCLRVAMRTAFSNEKERKRRAALGIDRVYDFSYEEVGKIMEGRLNGTGKTIISERAEDILSKHDCGFLGANYAQADTPKSE